MWHPIKNGLPEEGAMVVFADTCTGNFAAGVFRDGSFWFGAAGEYEEVNPAIISHWHALSDMPVAPACEN